MNSNHLNLQDQYIDRYIDEDIYHNSPNHNKKNNPYIFINNNKFISPYKDNHEEEVPFYHGSNSGRKNENIKYNFNNYQNTVNFNEYDYPKAYINKNERHTIDMNYVKKEENKYYNNQSSNNNINNIKKAKTNFHLYKVPNSERNLRFKKLKNNSNEHNMGFMTPSPRDIVSDKQIIENKSSNEIENKNIYFERKTAPYINGHNLFLNTNNLNYLNSYDEDYEDARYYHDDKNTKRNTYTNENDSNNILMNKIFKDMNNIKKQNRGYKINSTPDFKNNPYIKSSPNINENLKKVHKKNLKKKLINIPTNYNHISLLTTSHNIDSTERFNTDSYVNKDIQSERKERRNKKLYTRKDLRKYFQNNTSIEEKKTERKNIESFDENYLSNDNSKKNVSYDKNNLIQLKKYNSINEMNKPKRINKFNFKRLNRKELIEKVREINNNNRAKYKSGNLENNEQSKDKSNNIVYIYDRRNKTNEGDNCLKNYNNSLDILEKVSKIKINSDDINKMSKDKNVDGFIIKKNNKIISKNINKNKDTGEKIPLFTKSISYDLEEIKNDDKNLIIKKQKSQTNNLNEMQKKTNKITKIIKSNSKKNQEHVVKNKINMVKKVNKSKDKKRLEICNVSNINILGKSNKINNINNNRNIIIIINNNEKNKSQNNIPIVNNNTFKNKLYNNVNKNNNNKIIINNNNIPKNDKLNINNIVNINIIKQNNLNNLVKQSMIKNKENINNKLIIKNNRNSKDTSKNINNGNINHNNLNINNNKNYIFNNNNTNQIIKQNNNISKIQKINLYKNFIPQNIIYININPTNEKLKESASNLSKKPSYNNTDYNIEEIKPVIQHKIERKRPVYSLPPSQKRSVSQGKPFNLINKYYDENFILEDDDEENIKLNEDSFGDSEVKNNINILNTQNNKKNLGNVINKYLKKDNENDLKKNKNGIHININEYISNSSNIVENK